MSQGEFGTYAYVTSELVPRILPIRLQPETIAVSGGGSSSPTTGTQRVTAPGKSRKAYGIHARYVTIARKIGTGVGPYTGGTVTAKIAVGTPGQMAGLPIGQTVSYGGLTDWLVVSQTPEIIK